MLKKFIMVQFVIHQMEILLLVQHGDLKIFGLMKDIVLELPQQVVQDGNLQNGL